MKKAEKYRAILQLHDCNEEFLDSLQDSANPSLQALQRKCTFQLSLVHVPWSDDILLQINEEA